MNVCTQAHDFPQPYCQLRGGCPKPWRQRRDQLYFRGGCNGPTRGWRGPIWRFYPRKAANLMSQARPADLDGGVYDHCDSPKLNKHEWGWDAQMSKEMERDAPKKKIEPFGNNCNYRHLLARRFSLLACLCVPLRASACLCLLTHLLTITP